MPKPSFWQGVLCVVAILGLQAFLTWLDNAEDVRFVLLAVPLALVAGLVARRMRGGLT